MLREGNRTGANPNRRFSSRLPRSRRIGSAPYTSSRLRVRHAVPPQSAIACAPSPPRSHRANQNRKIAPPPPVRRNHRRPPRCAGAPCPVRLAAAPRSDSWDLDSGRMQRERNRTRNHYRRRFRHPPPSPPDDPPDGRGGNLGSERASAAEAARGSRAPGGNHGVAGNRRCCDCRHLPRRARRRSLRMRGAMVRMMGRRRHRRRGPIMRRQRERSRCGHRPRWLRSRLHRIGRTPPNMPPPNHDEAARLPAPEERAQPGRAHAPRRTRQTPSRLGDSHRAGAMRRQRRTDLFSARYPSIRRTKRLQSNCDRARGLSRLLLKLGPLVI